MSKRSYSQLEARFSSGLALWFDATGVLTHMNGSAKARFGRRKKKLGISDFDPTLDRDRWKEIFDIVRKKKKWSYISDLWTPWSERFPARWDLHCCRVEGKTLVCVFISDLTIQMQKERELTLAWETAMDAARTKSEFLANVSHEIRTPMNAVLGLTNLLMETELDSEQREYLDTIRRSGTILVRLINELLDLSKIEAGKLVVDRNPFKLRALVKESADLLQPLADQKKNAIHIEVEASVPDAVIGDAGKIRQVLMNLIGNAIKFTEGKSIRIRVKKGFRFEVEDEGIGIPEEAIGRLFQPFQQVDSSTTKKYGGTGLGLSLCKNIVELMGGQIGVESRIGKGSLFWFELPMESSGEKDSTPTAPAQRKVKGRRNGARILVVEDNAINQQVVVAYLKKNGFSVDVAQEGLEAIEKIEAGQKYDLILMDCQMPHLDGYETTRRIRATEGIAHVARTPIVAMTAYARTGDREKCLSSGMDDYVSKPIDPDLLFIKIEERLEGAPVPKVDLLQKPLENFAVLDERVLDRMRDLKSPETGHPFSEELIEMFLKATPGRVGRLEKAWRDKDYSTFTREAHDLKSTSGVIGALALSELARRLEECGEFSTSTAYTAWVEETLSSLHQNIRVLVKKLEALLPQKRAA